MIAGALTEVTKVSYNVKNAFSWGNWKEEASLMGNGLPWTHPILGKELGEGNLRKFHDCD